MRKAIIAAGIALAASTGAQAASVFSENFDATGFRGMFLENGTTDRFGNSALYYAASNNGWTFTQGNAGSFPNVLIATTTDGSNGALWLQEIGSSASRTITGLTAGKKYQVSFLQSGDNVPGSSWKYTVSADGNSIYDGSGTTQGPGTNPGVVQNATFIATGTSATLRFADASSQNGGNVVLDNISIVGVPEAATWALLIAGFGVTGFAARRRRSAVRVTSA